MSTINYNSYPQAPEVMLFDALQHYANQRLVAQVDGRLEVPHRRQAVELFGPGPTLGVNQGNGLSATAQSGELLVA